MSHRCEYTLENFTAEVEYNKGSTQVLVDTHLNELFRHLMRLNEAAPLDSFEFKLTEGSSYLYRWVTIDGRTWTQSLVFDNGSDPGQTFNVSDQFRLSEFQHHRALRDHIVRLHGILELQLVEVDFTV